MNYKNLKNFLEGIYNSNIKVFVSLIVLILIVYSQSLSFNFTSLDDYELIVNKFHILNRIENLPFLFKTNLLISESGIYYRPVVSLTFMIDTILGGKEVFMFHLSNVFYHMIASFLFFVLMNIFLQNRLQSFLLSLLFAIHPALSQAVVWIPGRNDSLLFIFLVISLILFQKYLKSIDKAEQKKIIFLILSGLSFFLALLIKENAFVILFFLILYGVFFEKEKLKFRENFFIGVTYLIPVIVYFILREKSNIQKLELENLTLSIPDYIEGIINYIGKIFLPLNLSVITLPENINLSYGIISIAGFLIFSLKGIKNLKIFFYGILWFLFFLLSGIVGFIGFTNFLDHRLYIPVFGIFLSISQLKILDRVPSKILTIFYLLIFIVFIYLNFFHTKSFRDPITFYESAVRSVPNSFFVQRGIANVYHRMKDYDKAEIHYRKSLDLNPGSVETLVNTGINFKRKGNLDSAEFYFLRALRINPAHSTTYNNLGNLYLQKGNFISAEYYLSKAVEINPDYFEAYNNLGVLYARLKKDSLAYQNFRKSIEINPDFSEGNFNLALYFYNINKIDSSRFYYQKAIENGFPEKNILKEKLNLSKQPD